MSAIAALANIPGTTEELMQWSFAHAAHHVDINRRIYEIASIALPAFVLDPFDPQDPTAVHNWAYLHQLMHTNQNLVLGIAGQDLTEIDWEDQGERAGWINAHFSEHYQAANTLGIG